MHASQSPGGLRFLENLAYLVPGYHGYRSPELRRGEDSRLRARVCREIDVLLHAIEHLSTQWTARVPEDSLALLGDHRARLLASSHNVRLAPGHLAGFFETERVAEVTLERVLEADLLIFQDLEETQAHVEQGTRLSTAPRTVRKHLRELGELLHRLDEHLIMRERILAGG